MPVDGKQPPPELGMTPCVTTELDIPCCLLPEEIRGVLICRLGAAWDLMHFPPPEGMNSSWFNPTGHSTSSPDLSVGDKNNCSPSARVNDCIFLDFKFYPLWT